MVVVFNPTSVSILQSYICCTFSRTFTTGFYLTVFFLKVKGLQTKRGGEGGHIKMCNLFVWTLQFCSHTFAYFIILANIQLIQEIHAETFSSYIFKNMSVHIFLKICHFICKNIPHRNAWRSEFLQNHCSKHATAYFYIFILLSAFNY